MSISSLGTGLSGLNAYQDALTVSANNVANSLTNGFAPKDAKFTSTAPGGVNVTAQPNPGTAPASASAPSGTNLTDEMVNQLTYKAGFEANAQVVKTSDQMLGTLINTKA
jgi:flagellar hook protein FlgE